MHYRNQNQLVTSKILVAHPNQQHSIELATALNAAGMLDTYLTTVFYKENSAFVKIMRSISQSFSKKMSRKQRASLDSKAVIRYRLLADMFYYFLGKNQRIAYRIYVYLTKQFGLYAAKYAIRHHCSAVVMFDYTAVTCFEYLTKHAPRIKKIIDMSSIPGGVIDRIISTEEKNGYGGMFADKRCRYSKENCAFFDREIQMADAFLSPSEFVDRALLSQGVAKESIFRASYGVSLKDFVFHEKYADENTTIRFVYTGKIEGAKGIHYLIDACDALYQIRKDFKVHLVGPNHMERRLFDGKEYLIEHGYLNKEELVTLYEEMHIFVLPSLWEGKSLSVLEALSSGLCEIVTESSGVDEIVRGSSSGIVIPAQNSEKLMNAMLWYLEHKDQIGTISKNAGQAVGEMTWDRYYKDVQRNIQDILERDI